jgi:hypothetical protein
MIVLYGIWIQFQQTAFRGFNIPEAQCPHNSMEFQEMVLKYQGTELFCRLQVYLVTEMKVNSRKRDVFSNSRFRVHFLWL